MSNEQLRLDELLAELEALKKKNADAEEALRKKVNESYAAWCRQEWKIGKGDIVTTDRGHEALVDSIYYGSLWRRKPWLLVRKKTKDGWAKNVTTAYGWSAKP